MLVISLSGFDWSVHFLTIMKYHLLVCYMIFVYLSSHHSLTLLYFHATVCIMFEHTLCPKKTATF